MDTGRGVPQGLHPLPFFFFDRKSKLASNSWPFCLGLQEARMTGIVPHQATSTLTEEENYLL